MVSVDHAELEKALMNLFGIVDVDKNGQISLKEWVGAFEAVDAGNNGVISRKQWQIHVGETCVFDAIVNKKHLSAVSRSEWLRTFEIADLDHDGNISIEEAIKGAQIFNLDVPHGPPATHVLDTGLKPTFFDMKHSNNGARIRLWIMLKDGAKDRIKTNTLTYADIKNPEYKAVNPLMKIPGLIRADGVCVFESNVILNYLEEKFCDLKPAFKPESPEDRQLMELMIRCHDLYVASPNCTAPGFSHNQGGMYLSYGWHGLERGMDLETRAAKLTEIWKQLSWLNKNIVGPYMVGEKVSLADFTWYPTTIFMEFMLQKIYGWPDIFHDTSGTFPAIAKWWLKLTEEPAFAEVRQQIYEYWEEMEAKGQFKPILEEIQNDTKGQFKPILAAPEADSDVPKSAIGIDQPTFFDMKHSNNGARIRLWIMLKDGAKDLIKTNTLTYSDIKNPEYKAVNPLMKIPGLVRSDGVCVFESNVILKYLEEKFCDLKPAFKPQSPEDRQLMELIIRCHDLYVASPTNTAPGFSHTQGAMYLSYGWHGPDRGMNLETRAAKFTEIWKQLTWLNQNMVGPYLVGEQLSLADFTWYPTTIFMEFMLPRIYGWPDIFRETSGPFPAIATWWLKLTSQPAFAEVRQQIYEYWEDMEAKGQFKPILEEIKNDTKGLKFKYP